MSCSRTQHEGQTRNQSRVKHSTTEPLHSLPVTLTWNIQTRVMCVTHGLIIVDTCAMRYVNQAKDLEVMLLKQVFPKKISFDIDLLPRPWGHRQNVLYL